MAATPQQYAYLAGLIDGDGCVALRWQKDKKARSGLTVKPQLQVTSKDQWFLEELILTFGGRLNKQGRSAFTGGQIWSINFSANEMREMLPYLIPYLVLKKKEARLLLEGLTITSRHRFKDYDPSGLNKVIATIQALKLDRKVI